jgi:hypothetical protein
VSEKMHLAMVSTLTNYAFSVVCHRSTSHFGTFYHESMLFTCCYRRSDMVLKLKVGLFTVNLLADLEALAMILT